MNANPRYLGKYQLVECIARGGMGEVWKALDSQLKREVAIKLLCPRLQQAHDFVMRFEQEARLIASLHHPNIIEIHDFKIHHFRSSSSPNPNPPLCYMVMDYVQGETLADYIYRFTSHNASYSGQLPPAVDIVYIFTVIGLALDYAHQHGIIHRDIKPANILLDQRIPTVRPMGEPILTDFGIARQYGTTRGTIAGCMIGTPKYMAPEQALGQYNDPRSDLYSLGIILYEMMTGVTPFHADTPLAIVMQHLHEKPIPPEQVNPHLSRSLSEVIQKSIAKDPDTRYPTAATLAVALAEAFNVPTPGRLADSDGWMPSVPPHSAHPQTDEALSHPSNAIQTPFTGLPSDQRMYSLGPQDKQSPQAVSGHPEYRDSLTSRHIPTDANIHDTHIIRHRLVETQHKTPSGVDVARQIKREHHEPGPRKVTAPSLFTHKKNWVVGLGILLVLVLLGSGLSILMLFLPANHGSEATIGHIRFVKTGPSQDYNALQIDIAQVPELPQGMAYYAWIELGSEQTISPHWQLPVSQQAVHTHPLTFSGVTNLYVPHRRFLITKEHTDNPPDIPDIDPRARLYYARIDPTPSAILDLKRCPVNDEASICS